MFLGLFIAANLASQGVGGQAAPVATQPIGKWVVEFGEQQCVASHKFSRGGNEFAVGLQPKPTTENYVLWLRAPKEIPRLESPRIAVGGIPIAIQGMTAYEPHPDGSIAYAVQLNGSEFLRLLQSATVVATTGGWSAAFELPRLAELRRTLDTCVGDLLATWGMSPAAQAQLASFPKPVSDAVSYVSAKDYPRGALNRKASGAVEARITVGADGAGKDCHILASSGDPDLDATTCAIYAKRVRYQPARTKRGEAVEGLYVVKLNWRL